ncbi:hypothetical protein [Variovorax sp. CF079]|uniref:hypothetical protein n=1 Tax=Variovorax sp. CF079 TaxID=1882774 RepID=UPI000B81E54F|nr:hypothetical protein [Variovorax sp. CF079]
MSTGIARAWLYEWRILIPGYRRLADWAREGFVAAKSKMLAAVRTAAGLFLAAGLSAKRRLLVFGAENDGSRF